ncbi:unnamed protein product, partial [Litomosoides sigmodontis]
MEASQNWSGPAGTSSMMKDIATAAPGHLSLSFTQSPPTNSIESSKDNCGSKNSLIMLAPRTIKSEAGGTLETNTMRRQSVVVEPTTSVISHEEISETKFDASNFSSLLPNLVQTTELSTAVSCHHYPEWMGQSGVSLYPNCSSATVAAAAALATPQYYYTGVPSQAYLMQQPLGTADLMQSNAIQTYSTAAATTQLPNNYDPFRMNTNYDPLSSYQLPQRTSIDGNLCVFPSQTLNGTIAHTSIQPTTASAQCQQCGIYSSDIACSGTSVICSKCASDLMIHYSTSRSDMSQLKFTKIQLLQHIVSYSPFLNASCGVIDNTEQT